MKRLWLTLLLPIIFVGQQIDLTKQVKGKLPLSNAGTNQNTWTAGRCVQVNSGGTALESASGGCAASGANTDITSLSAAAVYDKGGGVHNVKAYGAVGDGATDDYTAIIAAIAAASSGGVVYFPLGTYITGTTIAVSSPNIAISCAGWGAAIKAKGAAGLNNLIWAQKTATGFQIRGCKLDGNRANSGTSIVAGTNLTIHAPHSLVENVEVTASQLFGIGMGSADGVQLEHVTIRDSYIHDNGCVLATCDDEGGGSAIVATGDSPRSTRLQILNNRVERNYNTIWVNSTSGGIGLDATEVLLQGNTLVNNYNVSGGQIANMGNAGVARNWRIIGNTIQRTAAGPTPEVTAGIEPAFYGVQIIGNIISGHNSTNACGVAVQSVGTNWHGDAEVVGNKFSGNHYGVCTIDDGVYGPRAVQIVGNRFDANSVGLLLTQYASSIIVAVNDFNDNPTTLTNNSTSGSITIVGNQPVAIDNTLPSLAGSGNAFNCLDSTGKLYRSATACVAGAVYSVYNTWLAANCQGTAAALGFASRTTNAPTAACVTGTNTNYGVAQFADTETQRVQGRFPLPPDWTGDINFSLRWRSSATTGSAVWQIETACVADGETGDPAWNTAQAITDATKGTANQFNDASLGSALTVTGCAAGEEMFFRFLRDPAHASDDLGATAELIWIRFLLRRTQ